MSGPEDTVTVCAHSLDTGRPRKVVPGETHTCEDLANCPGSECICIPAEVSREELDRITEVPAAE